MIPIYEQGHGEGIGHGLDSFIQRFDVICREHLKRQRAKAFAFIFYDFTDFEIKEVLKDQGVFVQLDRLARQDLSVFYLHTGTPESVARFNGNFLSALGVAEEARTPCVVFFRLKNDAIEDVTVAQLDHANLIHGFHELYGVLDSYINDHLNVKQERRFLKLFKSGAGFVSVELFRAAIKKALEVFF